MPFTIFWILQILLVSLSLGRWIWIYSKKKRLQIITGIFVAYIPLLLSFLVCSESCGLGGVIFIFPIIFVSFPVIGYLGITGILNLVKDIRNQEQPLKFNRYTYGWIILFVIMTSLLYMSSANKKNPVESPSKLTGSATNSDNLELLIIEETPTYVVLSNKLATTRTHTGRYIPDKGQIIAYISKTHSAAENFAFGERKFSESGVDVIREGYYLDQSGTISVTLYYLENTDTVRFEALVREYLFKLKDTIE